MEKVLRSKIGALQQQVDELNAKQVELLSQKQQLQVSQHSSSSLIELPHHHSHHTAAQPHHLLTFCLVCVPICN